MTSISPKLVSIIIPTYNDTEALRKCLSHLSCQSFSKCLFEVVVCNNQPAEDLSDIIDEFSSIDIYLVQVDQRGSYAARNKGLKLARGKYIGFTDSDCLPDINWIENAVSLLNSGAHRVAGRIVLVLDSNEKLSLSGAIDLALGFDQKANVSKGTSVTANLFVARRVIDTVGVFASNLESGGDHEWNKRATNAGFSILYSQNCVVHHPVRNSFAEFKKKQIRVNLGIARLNMLHNKKFWRIHFVIRALIPRDPRLLLKLFRRFPRRPLLCVSAYFFLWINLIDTRIKIVRGQV